MSKVKAASRKAGGAGSRTARTTGRKAAVSRKAGAPSPRKVTRGKAVLKRSGSARRKVRRRQSRWHRLYTGLRRDVERYQPVLMFLALSIVVLGVYGMWANGIFSQTATRVTSAGEAVLTAGGMKIEAVTVRGRTKVSEEEVLAALGAYEDDFLPGFDVDGARARIKALPWVKDAKVMRLLPNRLHVELTEREAYAIWQSDGAFRLIDREGHVLETLGAQSVEQVSYLPHVVGEGANTHAAELLDLLEPAPALKSRLRAASRVGNRRWNLRLDNGITVRLPDTDVDKAVNDIIALDSEYRLLARKISVIDLRMPDVLIVRPRGKGETLPGSDWTGGGRRVVVKDQEV